MNNICCFYAQKRDHYPLKAEQVLLNFNAWVESGDNHNNRQG